MHCEIKVTLITGTTAVVEDSVYLKISIDGGSAFRV